MAVVVIGGQASGVGKTSAICALIAAMPERRWTAIKITQCSHQGGEKACDCELHGSPVAMTGWVSSGRWPVKSYAQDGLARTDTYRYMAAGAVKSLWIRILPGHLVKVMPRIKDEIARAGNVVIESNSVMEFLKPNVYAVAVSSDPEDFKPSAQRYLNLADAVLVAGGSSAAGPGWPDALAKYSGPHFFFDLARRTSPEFFAYVRRKIDAGH